MPLPDENGAQDEDYVLEDFVATPDVPHPTILLVGKRFSGKSTTSVAIAKQYDAPRWAAWCGTKDTQDYWAEKFGSPATVWGPDDNGKAALLRIIQFQERQVRLFKKILKKPFPKILTIGLVFDDVTSKRQFRKGEILEDLFSNGRHYKSIIIISCQYIKQLPPAVRTNTDYLFMLHNAKKVVRLLWEEYVENPDEFGMFLDLLRAVTGQVDMEGKDMYNSLVYNNCVKTNRLDKMFQVYRHVEGFNSDDITLGDPIWRKFNAEHYKDEEWESEKKLYRKRKREKRLIEYREKQSKRRACSGQNLAMDLDYFSDTDSEVDESDDDDAGIDNYQIRGKHSVVRIKMHNRRRHAGDGDDGPSYYNKIESKNVAQSVDDIGAHPLGIMSANYQTDPHPYQGYQQPSKYEPEQQEYQGYQQPSKYEPEQQEYQGYQQPSKYEPEQQGYQGYQQPSKYEPEQQGYQGYQQPSKYEPEQQGYQGYQQQPSKYEPEQQGYQGYQQPSKYEPEQQGYQGYQQQPSKYEPEQQGYQGYQQQPSKYEPEYRKGPRVAMQPWDQSRISRKTNRTNKQKTSLYDLI